MVERHGDVPLLIGGDVFHTPWEPSEAVNFALKYLPKGYVVPGNHDLPYHKLAEIKRSALGVLIEAKHLFMVRPGIPTHLDNFSLYGFPCGSDVTPCPEQHSLGLDIALAHSYIWMADKGYQGAKDEDRVREYKGRLQGYNTAIFGDNHNGFIAGAGDCWVLNCGCLIRRRQDEKDYKPSIGLIHTDGSVTTVPLDTSADVWADAEQTVAMLEKACDIDLTGMLLEFSKMSDRSNKFVDELIKYMNQQGCPEDVKKFVLEAAGR